MQTIFTVGQCQSHFHAKIFKWMDESEIQHLDLDNFTDNSNKGLLLEVHLEYPEELHDLHNDYPLAPEKTLVKEENLSGYSTNMKKLHKLSSGKVKKLINT